jgi:hypothetical protein
MPTAPTKTAPKKKLGVYVTLTSEQRTKLDEIGKRTLFQSDAAGDVLRIYINKHWTEIVGEKKEEGESSLFPEN